MNSRLKALIRKEFIQFFRNKPLLILVVWTIALEIAICAYAISYDVKGLSMAVYDLDRSREARDLVDKFENSGYFRLKGFVNEGKDIGGLMDRGAADVALVIPPEFSRWIKEGRPAEAQVVLDGTNSNTATIALGYASQILERYSLEVSPQAGLQLRSRSGAPSVLNKFRVWYNPDLNSVYFIVVSMMVLAVMIIAVIHPSAAIAMEKEVGTIEQLLVTPIRPYELLIAKVLPTAIISLAALGLSLWVPLWFKVPLRGSLVLFFVLSVLFLFSGLGLGIFFSTISQNLQQALLISFFAIFPVMVISGTLVPIESMPKAIQYLSYLSPSAITWT